MHPAMVGLHMATPPALSAHSVAAGPVSQFLQAQAQAMTQHQQFQQQQQQQQSMMEEKMAQWNALQYAMQVQQQQQQQQQHGQHQPISVGPTQRIAGHGIGLQRPDQPQWSATPALFARPVPIPSQLHHAQSPTSATTSPPFGFSHVTNAGGCSPLDSSMGYAGSSVHSGGSPAHSPQATSGSLSNNANLGSPTGSTPPATTSSSFEDGTESDGESKWGIVASHAHAQMMRGAAANMGVVGGPGGFAAMGMGMVM
jgi:hypothetical protein